MARRRGRKGSKKVNSEKILIAIAVVVGVLVAGVLLKNFVGSSSGDHRMKPTADFSIASYRKDGSRFASVDNRYVIEAKVESVMTHGNDRLVVVSMSGNPGERLPLFMPAENKGRVNITRGDSFLFDVTCKTGRTENGEQVKGILVIQNVVSI